MIGCVADTDKGFWQTAPGVITAVAALITAVGGLLAVLLQTGVIGGDSSPAPAASAVSSAAGSQGEQPDTGLTSPGSLVPWDQATAVLTQRDGTTMSVRAATVGVACDTTKVVFKNGQSVDMQLVSSISFDAIFLDNASADGTVELLDGRTLTDPIHTWNCPITAENELGRVEIPLESIQSIEFQR